MSHVEGQFVSTTGFIPPVCLELRDSRGTVFLPPDNLHHPQISASEGIWNAPSLPPTKQPSKSSDQLAPES